jgi:hypothetical protein
MSSTSVGVKIWCGLSSTSRLLIAIQIVRQTQKTKRPIAAQLP